VRLFCTRSRASVTSGEDGFTLLEMLVAVFITVLLLGITVRVFISARAYKARSEQNVELSATARAVGRFIRRDLAGCYMYLNAAGSFEIDDATSGAHELTIHTAAANPGTSEIATVTYYLDGTTLRRFVEAHGYNNPVVHDPDNGDFDLAEGVTRLEFQADPSTGFPRSVRVMMTFENDLSGRERTFTERVALPVEE